jgi:2,3-bisphosphoglycerate-independent phosphoglycerate mutase
MDELQKKYPFTQLEASGEAVGLPVGQIGNSEVGHTTIGAGCVLYQDLVRISKDAESNAFGSNEAFLNALAGITWLLKPLKVVQIILL